MTCPPEIHSGGDNVEPRLVESESLTGTVVPLEETRSGKLKGTNGELEIKRKRPRRSKRTIPIGALDTIDETSITGNRKKRMKK